MAVALGPASGTFGTTIGCPNSKRVCGSTPLFVSMSHVARVQVAVALSQVVALLPGLAGPNDVLPVMAVTAVVGPVHALACGADALMPGVMLAATAEFM